MIDFNTLNEDQKRVAQEFPEFASFLSSTPAQETTGPSSLRFTPEMKQVASEFPEFAGLKEKFPELTPPIPVPSRWANLAPIAPREPAPLPERGWIGDIATAIPRGVLGFGEMLGRAGRVVTPTESAYDPGILSEAIEALKKGQEAEWLRPSPEAAGKSWTRTAVAGGIESAIPSVGGGLTGAAAGAAIGSIIPGLGTALGALGGWVSYALGAGGIYGLSEYDRFMEEAKAAGIDEKKAKPFAVLSGLVEGGVEAATDLIAAKLLGVTGKSLSKPITNSIRQMLKIPIEQTAKGVIKDMPIEVGTEMFQNAAEQYLRQKAGIPADVTPWEAAKEAIGPTMVMTLLYGMGSRVYDRAHRQGIHDALTNPKVPEEQRREAILEITNGLKEEAESHLEKDPEASRQLATMALQWDTLANQSIDQGQPINIDQTIEEYLSQAQVPTLTERPTEEVTPAPGPGAVTPPTPGPGEVTPKYQEGQEIELEGTPYTIQNPEAFEKWEGKTRFKEKPETLVRKGVLAAIPIEEQAKPKEEKPPISALPQAAPAPTEKPRGIIPAAEMWNKTPADIQDEWMQASEYVERHQAEVDVQINGVQQKLDSLKGKRDKHVTAQRKELTRQLQELKGLREIPRSEYEDLAIRQSEELAEEARKKAAARGLPEEETDEFIEEFLMESSTERPYVERNWEKTVSQIFDQVLSDYLEKPTAEEIIPAKEEVAKPEEKPAPEIVIPPKPSPIETEGALPAAKEYRIFTRDEGWEPAEEAKPVKVEGFEAYDLFVHKMPGEPFYAVSEASTGMSIVNRQKTANQAVLKAKEILKQKVSEFPGLVEAARKETERVSAEIGRMGEVGKQPAKEEIVPLEFQKRPMPGAANYISKIKNKLKKSYAGDYHEWILNNRPEGKEPQAKGISAMAAQAVRMELDRFYPEAGPTPTPAPAPAEEWGAKNKVFTKERADRAREILRKKAGELRTGVDPELLQAGIDLAGYHIEAGARKFADYARKMIDEVGKWIRPYLKSFYNAVRDYPDFDTAGMDTYEDVAKIDVDKISEVATIKKEEGYGRRAELGAVERPGEIPLEEAPPELLPEPGEIRGAGEEGGERREVYPGRLQPGEGEALEEGLEAPGGERGGLGARERGMGLAPERGAGEGVRPEGRAEREPHAVAEIEKPAETGPNARNFRITPEVTSALLETGKKTKTRKNIESIRLLKKIEEENRLAAPEEQAILAQYSGWGGLPQAFQHWGELSKENKELEELLTEEEYESARASTPNAHYTTPDVAAWMWQALEHMGFKGGRSLDPAMGTGIFEGVLSDTLRGITRMSGVELDSISGRISKQLYQDADIRIMGYEQTKFPNDFFDVIITNVPFGDYKVHDRTYNKYNASIHDYFFLKSLDKVRPGGMVAFITSRYTMDTRNERIRKLIGQKADLVAAFRLPFTTFQEIANTEVVTDILFLRKKVPGQEFAGEAWMETKEIEVKDRHGEMQLFHRNEYFDTHPDHILGREAATGKMYAEGLYNVEPTGTLTDLLNERMARVPENVFAVREVQTEPSVQVQAAVPAPDYVKEGALVVVDDKIWKKQGDELVTVDVPEKQIAKTKRLIKIRDLARQLLHSEMVDDPEETIQHDMENLNKEYDRFVKLFGPFHDSKNRRNLIFAQDPDYPLILSLEKWDASKKTASKADIFIKRVVSPLRQITHVDTSKEALLVSLSETGQINFPRMTALTGKGEEEIQRDLAGIIFKNPDGERWETSDEYLSGNVREKLRVAESAAKTDPLYQSNVDAIKAVQPEDLTHEKIDIRLGTAWIEPEDISQFCKDILGIRGGLKIGYSPSIAMWVSEKPRQTWGINSVENTETYGTPYFRADELMILAMNHKLPTVRLKDEEGKVYVDVAATEAARDKQYSLKQRFKDWIWEDEERRQRLVRKYNDDFNNLRARAFDGSHLQLPGIVSEDVIKLKPWQKDGIWRIVQSPTTLLAHVVGAGKTFTMVGAAMELRRMGIIKKPMFVVPNHILDQWGSDFLRLYPNARILVAGPDDFKPLKRNVLMSRIATGDWDAVIVPHSSFFKIPMSKEAVIDYLNRQIDDLESAIMELVAAGEDKRRSKIIKEIEKAKKRLQAKIQDKLKEEEKTVNVTFEELGVDQLFLDEAHEFKNLLFATKMNRVAGISTSAADKSSDLHLKTNYLLGKYNRGIVFATGTPISNSMVEMFTMQRYLQPNTLAEYRVSHFDAWAANFGEVVPSLELAPEGKGFRVRSRFKDFINVPELLQMFHQVADVKLAEDLELERPVVEGGAHQIITCQPSQDLLAYVETLVTRAERIRTGQVHPTEDNMLNVTNDGRKAALDMRLINPSFTSGNDAKINKAANLINQIWKETEKDRLTQAVFIDLSTPAAGVFNVYDDLRTKLTQMGIPKNEIAFIHDFKTEEEKQSLFDRVNTGEIRVIFGSTKKLGFGTNIQSRLVAEHHLDAPWRPADIEQRDGRILRQGNMNPTVKIYRYVTEQSFDAYIWQLLENKAHSIAQVMTNRMDARRIEDIEGITLNYAQVKALATGDPRIIEKVQVDSEVRRLEMLRRQWQANRYNIQDRLAKEMRALPALERYAEDLNADIENHPPPEKFTVTLDGREYTDRKEAGETIQKVSGKMFREHQEGRPSVRTVGEYAGYKLVINSSKGTERLFFKDRAEGQATITESASGTIQSLEYQAGKGLKESLKNVERNIEETRTAIEKLKPELEKPFGQEDKLRELVKKQEELEKALDMDKGEMTEQLEGQEEPEAFVEEEAPRAKEKGEEEEEFALYGWRSVAGRAGVFDRYGHEVSGQTVEDIQKAIAPIVNRWHLGDVVKVVQGVEDVPESRRKPNMAAVYLRDWNKIVLVADRITDTKDAQRRLFHEALGHFGIRKMFGRQADPFLMQVYRYATEHDVLALDDIVETYRLDLDTREGKLTAGSEYLARLAERFRSDKVRPPSILERAYTAIRRFLRNLGFDLELTDDEINVALAGAARKLEKGEFAPERGKVTGEALYALTNPLSQTISQPTSTFDFLKNFKNRYTLDIKDNDLKKIMAFYGNPWHIGKKFPAFRKLIDIELKRQETRETLLHQLLANTVKGSESRIHEFLTLPEDQAKNLFRVMVWCDINNTFFTKEEDLKAKGRELGVDLNRKQISAYYAWKRTMNRAWDMLMQQAEKMTFRPFEGRPWFDDLKIISMTKKRDLKKNPDKKKRYEEALARVEALSQEERKTFERALERIKKPANRIRRLRMEMGRIKYYVPRTREKGKYVIRVYDAEDNVIWSERAKWEHQAAKIRERLKTKFPNMEIRESIEKAIPESIFQQISDASIQKFIDRAIDRAQKKEEISSEDANALRNALLEAVVDQLKERGFGQRMIRRKEGPVIGGYETEKGKKVFMDYISGLAGFLTKQEAAFDFYKTLAGINIRENTTLYQYANDYVRDMLRNTTEVDKWSGKARSIAFVAFLSGNLKMVPVQFTQNFITGIPALGRETKKPQKKYLKAMKDVVFGNLTDEERKAMGEEAAKGITQEQFVKEITGKTETGFSSNFKNLLNVLALPFAGMERFNRKAAALAMFRVARYEKKMSYEESLGKARDFVYDTHFLYGKSNLPSWTRAATTGAGIARTAYTFRSFTHNYLLLLGRTLRGPDGKIALDVLGRSLAYLALFGGLGALPFLDDLLDEWEKFFGTPVRKNMREALKGIGGEMLEKFGMTGVPALIGVDLSGSLRPAGLPRFTLKGRAEEVIYGVYGGLIDKGIKAFEALARDDVLRAIEFGSPTFIENLFKAYRIATAGATTPTGKILFDEEGRPIQLTGPEAVGQAMGFRPEKVARAGQEVRVLGNVEAHYKAKRDNLYAKFRLATSDEERQDILREVERYNLEVMKYQGAVPLITRESLRKTFVQKPRKAQLRFEQLYAQ